MIMLLTKELYVWYLFSLSVWHVTFLHGCVLLLIEEMDVWYHSTLSVWPQIVLAKNLPKGEIVGYLYVGLIIAKTNLQADVGHNVSTCGHVLSVSWFRALINALYLFKESTSVYLLAKTRFVWPESTLCLSPKDVTILKSIQLVSRWWVVNLEFAENLEQGLR